MLSKTIFAAVTALAAVALVPVRAQINIPPIELDADILLDDAATCPADAPPGTDVDAAVLSVVQFDQALALAATVAGITTTASVSADVLVCLCVDAEVGLAGIELPVDLQALAILDLNTLIEGDVTLTAIQQLLDLPEDVLDADVTFTPTAAVPCPVCPAEATQTCAGGVCSCLCPVGFIYDAGTNTCVLSASALTRRRARSLRA